MLCVDEKSQVQALDRTAPILPLRPGIPAKRTHDYKRNGTTTLFAALEIATGKVTDACYPRHRNTDGVPNVADRIAQTAAAMLLEEKLEPIFHPDSYGYRRGRSAHDALAVTRKRCWKQDWVLDLDVRAFLETSSHCSFADCRA